MISDLLPVNLVAEKAKFFANNLLNPQFQYSRSFTADELQKYGVPNEKMLLQARQILTKAYQNQSEEEIFAMEGKVLNRQEVEEKISEYLHANDITSLSVDYSPDYLSRASIKGDILKIRLPIDFREEGLAGMLNHEIGTHYLRTLNYRQQPYYKQRNKFGFSDYLETEEGLASIHDQLAHSFKLNIKGAIRYLAVYLAQKGSFIDVWNGIAPYVDNLERRWMIAVRAKRGVTDTSLPGGLTKDMLYLSGFLKMLAWLEDHDYDLSGLYLGKISADDVGKARQLKSKNPIKLPIFYMDRAVYADQISSISDANNFNLINQL